MSSSQARLAQHVGNGRKRGASEGPQGAARQLEAGEPLELVMGRHEHRQPLAAGLLARALFHSLDKRRHGGQPLLFHEKRDRFHTAFEGPLDHLLRLGDEQRPLRLQLAAQLSLGQPRERIEPRIVQRVYIDKGHRYLQKKKSQLNYSWRERAGGAKVSESPTGACNCLAFCPSVLWYAPRQKQEARAGACRARSVE